MYIDLETGAAAEIAPDYIDTSSNYHSWNAGAGPSLRAAFRSEVAVAPKVHLGVGVRYRFMFYSKYGLYSTYGMARDGTPRVHELDLLVQLDVDLGNHGPRFGIGPMLSSITNKESLRNPYGQSKKLLDSPSGVMVDAGWTFGIGRYSSAITTSLSWAYLGPEWASHWYLGVGYRYSFATGG